MDESSFFDALSSGTSLKDLAAQHDVTSDQRRSLLLGPVKGGRRGVILRDAGEPGRCMGVAAPRPRGRTKWTPS